MSKINDVTFSYYVRKTARKLRKRVPFFKNLSERQQWKTVILGYAALLAVRQAVRNSH